MTELQTLINKTAPIPFESLVLPIHLDGSQGVNRHEGGYNHIEASTDRDAIRCWLDEFESSPQTYNSLLVSKRHYYL